MPESKFCYSFDKEAFYEEFQDAFEDACDSVCGGEEFTMYVGIKHTPNLVEWVSEDSVIDCIIDQAYECVGDVCTEWGDKILNDVAGRNELERDMKTLVSEWIKKNHPPKFYEVREIKEERWLMVCPESSKCVLLNFE